MSFDKYLKKIKGNYRPAVKVEWLNPDESVNFDFTNDLYDLSASVTVNYQKGSRRSCSLTINNEKNKHPINVYNIWFGQKFKLWMGIYLDNETPYYLPQGVFLVSNPSDTYTPDKRIVSINGVDKWANLDGTLFGKLPTTFQTNIGVNLANATRSLLSLSNGIPSGKYENASGAIDDSNISEYFEVNNIGDYYLTWGTFETEKKSHEGYKFNESLPIDKTMRTDWIAKCDMTIQFDAIGAISSNNQFYITQLALEDEDGNRSEKRTISLNGQTNYSENIIMKLLKGEMITFKWKRNGGTVNGVYVGDIKYSYVYKPVYRPIDPIPPLIPPSILNKTYSVESVNADGKPTTTEYKAIECPYTVTIERGRTYADVLLEYATILGANIYYDVNGRLVLEPIIDTADDITDTNKEILWDYSVNEKTFLGLTQTYNFDKVYNDFIVLGNIVNGYQFKARVQNRNPMSSTCIQRIGLKSKEPKEDNQYYSDRQCEELAIYEAKISTIMQKSGSIPSTPLFHMDVNKLVTVSTPNNNMSKELFLVTGFSLSASGTMTLNVTSVNILKNFSVVKEDVYV